MFVTQNTDNRTCIHNIEKLLKFNNKMAKDTLKGGKSLEQSLHKSSYTDDQWACEQVSGIISHQWNGSALGV